VIARAYRLAVWARACKHGALARYLVFVQGGRVSFELRPAGGLDQAYAFADEARANGAEQVAIFASRGPTRVGKLVRQWV
jgi:hypothetical protein